MSETLAEMHESWGLSYPEASVFELTHERVQQAENGDFVHDEIAAYCLGVGGPPSILLESGLFERARGGEQFALAEVEFTERPEWAEGRTDSLHVVQFGVLALTSSSGQVTEVDVAIKPYHIWRKGASNELAALIKAQELTGIRTFEPLGAIYNGKSLATVTRFEGHVVSLDNQDWTREVSEPINQGFDIVEALQKSAMTLARLHRVGIIHNDAQVKNMAVSHDGDTTSVRLIDLESSKWRNVLDLPERQRYLDGVHSDVSTFVGSVLARGLWQNADYGDKAKAIELLFTEPYRGFLGHPGNRYGVYDDDLHEEVQDRVDSVLQDI